MHAIIIYLYDNSSNCSLIIADSNVDDACLNLELFLESYWASTRSVMLLGGGLCTLNYYESKTF